MTRMGHDDAQRRAQTAEMNRTGRTPIHRLNRRVVVPAVLLGLASIGAAAAPAWAAPPPNDTFSSATVVAMSSDTVMVAASNVEATAEAGEDLCCFTGKTVWFSFTANDARPTTIRTTGGFDTYLAVFTASNPGSPSVTTLALVSRNDNVSGADTSSSVTIQPTVGTKYYLQLGSANAGTPGSTNLVLTRPAPPAATTTTLKAPRKVWVGKKATISVSVSTAGGPASGTVTVAVDGKVTTLQLVYGTATMKTRKLRKPGKVTVAVEYQPTATTLGSRGLATIKVKRRPRS